MKLHLILALLACSALCHAQGVTGAQARPQAKPAPALSVQVQPSAPPRHLSDVERAELRRQLQEFNRRYVRRS